MKSFFTRLNKDFQKRAIKIDKRVRLVVSVLLSGILLLFSTFFYFDQALIFIPLIIVLTYFFTYFSLLEGIEKVSWYQLFFMPVLVAFSFYLFYFLIPSRWLTRIPFMIFFEISMYAVLLCSNIFNVGVEKSLGLYRAAFSINFLYQAVVSFLLFNLLFALKTNFLVNGLVAGVIGFTLSLNLFWTIRLKRYIESETLKYSLFVGMAIFQLSVLISFLPLSTAVYALFLTSSYYSLAGLIYNYIDERLFKETIREFVGVFIIILIITFLSLSW